MDYNKCVHSCIVVHVCVQCNVLFVSLFLSFFLYLFFFPLCFVLNKYVCLEIRMRKDKHA